tara:strand:- start:3185 stop:3421 length:237 start_codon:yes stop_codon:yes gene_type:complete
MFSYITEQTLLSCVPSVNEVIVSAPHLISACEQISNFVVAIGKFLFLIFIGMQKEESRHQKTTAFKLSEDCSLFSYVD